MDLAIQIVDHKLHVRARQLCQSFTISQRRVAAGCWNEKPRVAG